MPIDVNVSAENRDDAVQAAVYEAIQNDIDNDLYAATVDGDDWDDEDWED